jgi:hypothetical protein
MRGSTVKFDQGLVAFFGVSKVEAELPRHGVDWMMEQYADIRQKKKTNIICVTNSTSNSTRFDFMLMPRRLQVCAHLLRGTYSIYPASTLKPVELSRLLAEKEKKNR